MQLYGTKRYNVINKEAVRPDGKDKVTGRANYTADLSVPGMLYGGCCYSSSPHARIKSVDVSEARTAPGVKAVLTAADIPVQQSWCDYYFLADGLVRYYGEVIAIVAAESQNQLKAALNLIRVEYEELPAVFTIDDALVQDAPIVRESGGGLKDGVPDQDTVGNIFMPTHRRVRKGDAEQALEESDIVLERTYTTDFGEHAYIEPEAVLVTPGGDGGVVVHAACHYPFFARRYVAQALQLPLVRVRFIQAHLGGSFGAKEEMVGLWASRAALLMKATGLPVKMAATREESMRESPKRHPFKITYKAGVTKEGRLRAISGTLIANSGAYNDQTPVLAMRAQVHSAGPFDVANVKTDFYGVYTNNVSSGAFRGYSAPQIDFAVAMLAEELAEALQLDVADFYRINLLRQGSVTPTGETLEQETILLGMMEDVLKKTDFQKKREQYRNQPGEIRKGIGLAPFWRGCGEPADANNSCGAFITALDDGTFLLNAGLVEMGQGLHTAFLQIAAETLGVPYEAVRFARLDTDYTEDCGVTVASRSTAIASQAVYKAARDLRKMLLETAGALLGVSPKEMDIQGGVCVEIRNPTHSVPLAKVCTARFWSGKQMSAYCWHEHPLDPLDKETGQGKGFPSYCYGVVAAEVEVDMGTGYVDVKKITAAHDLGTVINPGLALGQIYGGIAMGMGYATLEDIGAEEGWVRNENFDSYLFPTAVDMPEIEAWLYECDDPTGTYGAKSIAEPATEAVSAAIACAVANAAGRPFRDLPLDLESVCIGRRLSQGGVKR